MRPNKEASEASHSMPLHVAYSFTQDNLLLGGGGDGGMEQTTIQALHRYSPQSPDLKKKMSGP